MLKWLKIITVLAILFAHCPNEASAQQKQQSDNTAQPPITVNCNNIASDPQSASKQKPLEPHAGIEYSQWALVFIAALTGWAVFDQARAATKAAKSAETSASALVNSERAWVIVEVKFPLGAGPLSFSGGINDGSTITDFEIIVKNAGRTPAWVYEQRVQMTVSKLPPLPAFDETAKTDIGVYPVVQDQPATTWKPFVEAKGLPDLDGQPYIFGVVRYRDSFSDSRETYFGYVVSDHKRLERLPNPAYNMYT
jgi:hypothetical protein